MPQSYFNLLCVAKNARTPWRPLASSCSFCAAEMRRTLGLKPRVLMLMVRGQSPGRAGLLRSAKNLRVSDKGMTMGAEDTRCPGQRCTQR